jgi:molybdate transport system substrate-binding protein
MILFRWRCLIFGFLAAVGGCSGGGVQTERADDDDQTKRPVIVLVAASTKNAIEEIATQFQTETGIETKISAGPSNALANQVIAGGDADLFLSANLQWADAVEKPGHVAKRRNLLTNGLVLVVPKDNPAQVKRPDDLTSTAVKKIALAGEKVPAGMYADQALASLKLASELAGQNKIVRGHDVRSTLAFVERGEAEAGIVYSTDALISTQVQTVYTFDPKTHDKIAYPLALLKTAQGRSGAKAFYDYLSSKSAAEVFRRHGFELLGE